MRLQVCGKTVIVRLGLQAHLLGSSKSPFVGAGLQGEFSLQQIKYQRGWTESVLSRAVALSVLICPVAPLLAQHNAL